MMIGLFASGLLAASTGLLAAATPAKITCGVQHLTACRDTNMLLGSPGVARAMTWFLGRHANDRLSYLYTDGRLIGQIWTVLGGPPDDRRDLSDGVHLFTACRPHSCPEKGAVAFDAQGRIKAVGIVNFHCAGLPEGCSSVAMLDLFIRDEDQATKVSCSAIIKWATEDASVDVSPGNPRQKRVFIHTLIRTKS